MKDAVLTSGVDPTPYNKVHMTDKQLSLVGTRLSMTNVLRGLVTLEVAERIATTLIGMAESGDQKAIDMIYDRLDGKVLQGIVTDSIINVLHNMPAPVPQECIEGVYEDAQHDSDTEE